MQLESLEENPGWVPGNFAGSPKASLGLPAKDVLSGMRAVLGSILGGRGLSAGVEQLSIRCPDRAVVTQGKPTVLHSRTGSPQESERSEATDTEPQLPWASRPPLWLHSCPRALCFSALLWFLLSFSPQSSPHNPSVLLS